VRERLGAVLATSQVDLVLSGDNALVIGAAARLPPRQRTQAVVLGGVAIGYALRRYLAVRSGAASPSRQRDTTPVTLPAG
jgi:predicted tellurium resistance membrane protein TerC